MARAESKAGSGRVTRSERSGQLLDIALEIAAERGYGALTMAEVARAAGVSKPIVYRSFPNRAALTLAMLRREQKRTDALFDEIVPTDPGDRHPRDVLIGAVRGILDAAERHPLTWRLILLPPEGTPKMVHDLVSNRRERLVRRARRLIRWGVPYLDTDEELDVDVLARGLVAIVEEQARIVLTDTGIERATLLASSEALLSSLAWRRGPDGAE